jgi:hypothetical protein
MASICMSRSVLRRAIACDNVAGPGRSKGQGHCLLVKLNNISSHDLILRPWNNFHTNGKLRISNKYVIIDLIFSVVFLHVWYAIDQ